MNGNSGASDAEIRRRVEGEIEERIRLGRHGHVKAGRGWQGSEGEWRALEIRAIRALLELEEARLRPARAASAGMERVREARGSEEFERAVREIEAAGEHLVSLSRGKGNGDWILRSLPRRLVQGHLFRNGALDRGERP